MKKLFILMTFLLSCLILNSQDNKYSRSYPITTPDTLLAQGMVIKTDIANIQYCLGKYYQERRIAAYFEIGAAVSFATFYALAVYTDSDSHGLEQILLGSSVGLAVAGVGIYIDADKWLKRGSIRLSPGSIRVYF